MLREIAIKNFAIIEELRIEFSGGLTILSGETGAGKSIIISALNIILGSRADASMIRTGSETAEIEALFDIDPAGEAARLLREQGYDDTDELLIRRILSGSNRHRVYINGRLATMQALNAITENLAGISGQHEHQRLLKESEHLRILDQFGGCSGLRREVAQSYRTITSRVRELEDMRAAAADQAERFELLTYQKEEIEKAAVSAEEDAALEQELTKLKHAESLYQGVGQSLESLYNREGAVADQISEITKTVEKASSIDPALAQAAEALSDISFRISDTAEQLRTYLDTISFDPGRIDEIESRLDTLNRLKRKYGGDLESILAHLEKIESQLTETENLSDRIRDAEAELDAFHEQLVELARRLSEKREAAARLLSEKMEAEFRSLNMPDTRFEVVFNRTGTRIDSPRHLCMGDILLSESGGEQAVFMISPNVGEDLKFLSKIASGGELSRVILALKAILADTEPVETMIFDEVDAGIGGQTAEVVGKKIADLAACNQVICITHLAQIAKFGNQHFRIEKHAANGRTATRIIRLDETARVDETARMIGGSDITETTRAHAEEMLRSTVRSG